MYNSGEYTTLMTEGEMSSGPRKRKIMIEERKVKKSKYDKQRKRKTNGNLI